jgi:hypothetical protein
MDESKVIEDEPMSMAGELVPLTKYREIETQLAERDAQCAEMRAHVRHQVYCNQLRYPYHGVCDCGASKALSTDAGKGWVSPEEHEKLRAVAEKGEQLWNYLSLHRRGTSGFSPVDRFREALDALEKP